MNTTTNNLTTTVTMSSGEIAELTGKLKKSVHRDIKEQLLEGLYGKVDGTKMYHEPIQGLTIIEDERGYWKEVHLDRYHTDVLVSGYEVKYRAAIVKRWHELEAAPVGLTSGQILLQAVQQMVALEMRQAEYDKALAETQQAVEVNTRRLDQIETASDYFAIIGWHRYVRGNNHLDLPTAARMGRQATVFCNDNDVPMGTTPDPRFGRVNTYPKWVLDHLFSETIN